MVCNGVGRCGVGWSEVEWSAVQSSIVDLGEVGWDGAGSGVVGWGGMGLEFNILALILQSLPYPTRHPPILQVSPPSQIHPKVNPARPADLTRASFFLIPAWIHSPRCAPTCVPFVHDM